MNEAIDMPSDAEIRKRVRKYYGANFPYKTILLLVALIAVVSVIYFAFLYQPPMYSAEQINNTVSGIEETLRNASDIVDSISKGIK